MQKAAQIQNMTPSRTNPEELPFRRVKAMEEKNKKKEIWVDKVLDLRIYILPSPEASSRRFIFAVFLSAGRTAKIGYILVKK